MTARIGPVLAVPIWARRSAPARPCSRTSRARSSWTPGTSSDAERLLRRVLGGRLGLRPATCGTSSACSWASACTWRSSCAAATGSERRRREHAQRQVFGIGPKVRLVKDRLALYVPVGRGFGGGDDNNLEDSWAVHPTLLFTVTAHRYIEVNASAKHADPRSAPNGGDDMVAFNLGLGLGRLQALGPPARGGVADQPGRLGALLPPWPRTGFPTVRGIVMRTIRTISSPYTETAQIPKGPGAEHAAEGVIKVEADFEPGLRDIEGFSHSLRAVGVRPPRRGTTSWACTAPGHAAARGSPRRASPRRPSPIALTVVAPAGARRAAPARQGRGHAGRHPRARHQAVLCGSARVRAAPRLDERRGPAVPVVFPDPRSQACIRAPMHPRSCCSSPEYSIFGLLVLAIRAPQRSRCDTSLL